MKRPEGVKVEWVPPEEADGETGLYMASLSTAESIAFGYGDTEEAALADLQATLDFVGDGKWLWKLDEDEESAPSKEN